MVPRGCHVTKPGCVIASTGPTIEDDEVLAGIREYLDKGYTLIALKESIRFLTENHDMHVEYSVSMDPGKERQIGRTPVYDHVTYCIASSCNPGLVQHVLDNGGQVKVFHSACGYSEAKVEAGFAFELSHAQGCVVLGEYCLKTDDGLDFVPVASSQKNEIEVYRELFPSGDVMQGGFTVTNRTLALASYMGFPDIVLAGCDFGWRAEHDSDTHYASFVEVGAVSPSYVTDEGKIDGVPWHTRPDQLISAIDIAKRARRGELTILGDTLPMSLTKCDEELLETMATVN